MITAVGAPFELGPKHTARTYTRIPLRYVVEATLSREVLAAWQHRGLITLSDGFGLAIADPRFSNDRNGPRSSWNDPEVMGWFVYGYGKNGRKYAHDAARKNRTAVDTHGDTLITSAYDPSLFTSTVASVEADGTFLWGNCPEGGSKYVEVGVHRLLVGVSGLDDGVGNDFIAGVVGNAVGLLMHRADIGKATFGG